MSDLTALRAAVEAHAAAEKAVTEALARRDAEIAAVVDDGARVLDVQIATGLSERRISQIRKAHREAG